jgi:hypothetical protein
MAVPPVERTGARKLSCFALTRFAGQAMAAWMQYPIAFAALLALAPLP